MHLNCEDSLIVLRLGKGPKKFARVKAGQKKAQVTRITLPYSRPLAFYVPYRPADAFRGHLTIPKLLQLLSLLSLQAFTFDCSNNHASPDHELRDLITRSGCSLKSFVSDLSIIADL